MQDTISIIDCENVKHTVKINNVKDFSTYQYLKKHPITTVHLKELENNLLNIKTYESEDSIRDRFSMIYDDLHKTD